MYFAEHTNLNFFCVQISVTKGYVLYSIIAIKTFSTLQTYFIFILFVITDLKFKKWNITQTIHYCCNVALYTYFKLRSHIIETHKLSIIIWDSLYMLETPFFWRHLGLTIKHYLTYMRIISSNLKERENW